MPQVTPHFTKEELEHSNTAIRLGLPNVCPDDLYDNMVNVAEYLETVRNHFGVPIHVLSCYRSPAVNAAVGGSPNSAHRFAHAADFTVEGHGVKEVALWCSLNITDYDQIIYEFGELGWIHIGFRNGTPRKQCLTATKQGGKTVYANGIV